MSDEKTPPLTPLAAFAECLTIIDSAEPQHRKIILDALGGLKHDDVVAAGAPRSVCEEAATLEGFRWMPGMVYRCATWSDEQPSVRIPGPEHCKVMESMESIDWTSPPIPDLDDLGTLGCIEHGMIPHALRDPNACLRWNGTQWEVVALYPGDDGRSVFGREDTKAEALVAALKAAPRSA